MKDPYSALGVSKSATATEIKTAYRNLAKKFHPDLNPGKKEAEAKFKDISAAYDLIGTEEARAKFDRGESDAHADAQQRAQQQAHAQSYYQSQQRGGGGRYSRSFGDDDMRGAQFGGDGGGSGGFGGGMYGDDLFENLFRSRANQPTPGQDEKYQMEVEFKEAALGAERVITLPNGKKLQVKIPAGVKDGGKLRFKNEGGAGQKGAPNGDAYIEIKVKPLAGFTRVGNDIETELPISFIEAIMGAEVKVNTLDGAVMLNVPAGVSTGNKLRVRGKGMAIPNTPGDQIVVLKIVVPKKIDPELQAAIKAWDGKFSYDPRSSS
jgi:DnaJ-class molecular chaperone